MIRRAALTTFRSLRTRNFRLFFLGQLVSQVGTWMQYVAIVWVVNDMTGDGVYLGLVTAAQFLPLLVLGPWAGLLSDRLDRRRLMQSAQVAFLAVALAFAGLTFAGRLSLPLIYVLSALFGVVNALDNPARRALVADLVDEPEVPNAVGLNSALMTGSRVIGPAIGGVLLVGPGPGWCFVLNAASYVAVITALARMDRSSLRAPPRVAREKGQLRAGLRYVWRTPELRLPLVLVAAIGTFAYNFAVTLPLLADRTLGGGAAAFTLLYSTMSVGSVVGALLVARRADVGVRFVLRGSRVLAVAMLALALAPSIGVAAILTVPVGFAAIAVVSGANAVVQLHAEPEMRGRVLALLSVVFLGSTPIGGPIAGAVSEVLGPRAGVLLGAIAAAVAAAWTAHELRRSTRGGQPGTPADAGHSRDGSDDAALQPAGVAA